MKKYLVLFASFLSLVCFGQKIIIHNNVKTNGNVEERDCGYKINGVCSSEDIGGVDTEVFFKAGFYLKLTNYNQFPVTVLWEAEYNHGDRYRTGSTVLGAYGTNNSEKIISLHDGGLSVWSLVGTITRKLKN